MSGIDYCDFFVAEARRNGAPLYECLASGVARNGDLRRFANTVQPGQPPANVLFASVHYLLLRGAQHPLRVFYPTLTDTPDDPARSFPAFCDFAEKHREEIGHLLRTRVTNTNEVGRSAMLHAGFRELAREARAPLHLIELGPSAGLNLLWDRYAVSYLRNGETIRVGPGDARLVLETGLRGEGVPPTGESPPVATRLGLERNPVDLTQRDERDWLKALVWPDHRARFQNLERALAVVGEERLPIRAGDALGLLPEALSEIPALETACVYHTFVTYQFSEDARTALDDLLIAASLRRPLWRLGWEGTLSGEAPLLLYRYRDGLRDKRLLALCQPHGAWMEWRA
ncbi:MAG: DUF2332 domain-containing protein [Rhizomicrobium sp.]